MHSFPDVLFEDNHCLAVSKPTGVPSTHFDGTVETIDRALKRYLKEKYQKPGNVFLGVVHRLDKPVSGVLLFARTSKAAARLSQQFCEGTIEKVYWAIVEGAPPESSATLVDWLRKSEETHAVCVVASNARGAQRAELGFQRLTTVDGLSSLEVRPRTGRKHQIRVQLAARGMPIYGDRKYGSGFAFGNAIALHARSLQFRHPVRDEMITVVAGVPPTWRTRFSKLILGVGD
jgi:23S rRNA pseudouridine1911/1915/1917 synthase